MNSRENTLDGEFSDIEISDVALDEDLINRMYQDVITSAEAVVIQKARNGEVTLTDTQNNE